ncbi:MAG: L,D-transpeptidase [Solirubrobacterales bacterium]
MKLPALIAALAVAAAAVFLIAQAGDDDSARSSSPARYHGVIGALRASVPVPDVRLKPPRDRVKGPSFPIAIVREGHTIALHDSPGGRVIDRASDRTEFGSIRVLWIERVRGAWFGVPAPEFPDGELAWIRDDRLALDVYRTRFWIDADVSQQLLQLHYGNRVLGTVPVTVGSPGSPTPLGDYSVTDALAGRDLGSYYGCCVLALTGHQPNLPANWIGGDRIAIHGTPYAIGGARSAGCLRAANDDMVSLFARVPLGAPVFIHG